MILLGVGYFYTNFEGINGPNSNGAVNSKIFLAADDVNMTFNDSTEYVVQLTDANNYPLALKGEIIKVTFKDKTYDCKTNESGAASLPINLIAGNYTFTAEYNGEQITNNVIVNAK